MSVTVRTEPFSLNVTPFDLTNGILLPPGIILLYWTTLFRTEQLIGLLLLSDKDAVEKRLYVLQQQGYIYATDPT